MRAKKCFIILSLFSFLTMLLPLPAAAGGSNQSVGLVLSGGGAKGIAHIGVIKALEENDIPIDCITGTSMGAIVGALYACGYSPDEMMELLNSQYFAAMSTGRIDPELNYYFASEAPSPRMFSVPVGAESALDSAMFDPQSLIPPTPMAFGFMQLFSAYSAQCGNDFDRLFVPYRCASSNLSERRSQVMKDGDLADAVRSSMSFPLVFQAVKINDDIFYDGGIYDNFPVNVMTDEFNPAVMLGVDVSSTASDGPPNSYMDQLDLLVTRPQSYALPADKGIKMRLHLDEFGLLDFNAANAIYEIGYRQAMEMMDSIKSRIKERRPAAEVRSRRAAFKAATPPLRFEAVNVHGGTKKQNAYVRYLFRPSQGCDTIGIDRARLSFYRAFSSGKISSIRPQAYVSDESKKLFTLDLTAKFRQKFSLGFGGYICSSNNSFLYVSANYSSLSFSSISTSAEAWIGQSYMAGALRASLSIPSRVPSAFRLTAVASRRKYYENEMLFFRDSEPTFITKHEFFGKLAWATAAHRTGEIEAGIGGGRLYNSFYRNNDPESYLAGRDHLAQDLGQVYATYTASTLDYNNYPTSGYSRTVSVAGVYGRTSEYNALLNNGSRETSQKNGWLRARAAARQFFTASRHWAVGVEGEAVYSNRPLLSDYFAAISTAEAFTPTPASDNLFTPGLRANSFIAVGAVPVYKYNERLSARFSAQAFVPFRRILCASDGTAAYGRAFGSADFFGELDIVYHLPFAAVSAYGNYSTAQHHFNVGIALGIYITAPSFF